VKSLSINDIDMLKKIGTNAHFPLDGSYELTADLDGRSFTKPIKVFEGDLNGMNHTISNMTCSLIKYLNAGRVRNLIIRSIHNFHRAESEHSYQSFLACQYH
jgi:hypothetical protein